MPRLNFRLLLHYSSFQCHMIFYKSLQYADLVLFENKKLNAQKTLYYHLLLLFVLTVVLLIFVAHLPFICESV